MRARISNIWQSILSGLWFIPALLALSAIILASLALFIDNVSPELGGIGPWLFGGSASAARGLLQAIAGSMITVVSLAFSITIVAVQQASTQFSPRVIRNFMRDRANQLVFGVYIATFIYALLVLRMIREDRDVGTEFVPALAVTGAMLLALLCVALLIFYIHHTASSLQVSTIADEIHRELLDGIDHLYPSELGDSVEPEEGELPAQLQYPPTVTVYSEAAGFIRVLEEDHLLAALTEKILLARVRPQVGDYVFRGDALIDLWVSGPIEEDDTAGAFRSAFALGRERSSKQDILFSLRQLVDIAIKALSPGINDPTTAEECLSHLGDVVAQVAGRRFPSLWRQSSECKTYLLFNRPDFAAIVHASFDQIRREAASDVHVTLYFLTVLEQIARQIKTAQRAAAIRDQVHEVLNALGDQGFSRTDEVAVQCTADRVLTLLHV